MSKPSPLSYSDVTEYLVALFDFYHQKNERFSVRAWAKKLKFVSPGHLNNILKRRRPVTLVMGQSFVNEFGLTRAERKHFEKIVQIQAAETSGNQDLKEALLEELSWKNNNENFDSDRFKFISDWYHLPIFEALSLKSLQGKNLKHWVKKFKGRISEMQIKLALERLHRLGLVQKSPKGEYSKKSRSSLVVGKNVPSETIRVHHQQFGELALQILKDEPIENRFFSGVTIAVTKKDLPSLHSILAKANQELLHLAADGEGDDVYRVNIQCFKLTE